MINLSYNSVTRKIIVLAVVLVVVDLLFFNNILELRAEEPRRSIVAIEMLETGEYIVPHIHGDTYYNKPPVFNWLIAGTMAITGTGEWSARFPGALSFLLIGLVIFKVLEKNTSRQTGLLGAFAFYTSGDLLFYGAVNTAEIDLFYALVVVLQALAIFKYRQSEEYFKLFLISYLLTAVGLLTKGIPSLAFQALTLLVYLSATKRFLKLFSWQHIVGILGMVTIVGGYLYAFSLEDDAIGFMVRQFKETSQRTANEYGALAIVGQLFQFPVTLIVKMLPWSLFVVFLFFKPVRRNILDNKFLKFCLIFILANIIIYWTAPDVRVRYIYMFFPFMLMLVMAAIEVLDWEKIKLKHVITIPANILVFATGVAFIALPFIVKTSSPIMIGVSMLIGLCTLYLGWVFIKNRNKIQVLWILVVGLLMGRLGYNIIVLPEMHHLSSRLIYRGIVNDMLEVAGDKEIYLTGPPQKVPSDVSFMGKQFYKDTLSIPPSIPYQIPYYYSHYTSNIMHYQEDSLNNHQYYLMYDRYASRYAGKTILYEFIAENNKSKMILFELD